MGILSCGSRKQRRRQLDRFRIPQTALPQDPDHAIHQRSECRTTQCDGSFKQHLRPLCNHHRLHAQFSRQPAGQSECRCGAFQHQTARETAAAKNCHAGPERSETGQRVPCGLTIAKNQRFSLPLNFRRCQSLAQHGEMRRRRVKQDQTAAIQFVQRTYRPAAFQGVSNPAGNAKSHASHRTRSHRIAGQTANQAGADAARACDSILWFQF